MTAHIYAIAALCLLVGVLLLRWMSAARRTPHPEEPCPRTRKFPWAKAIALLTGARLKRDGIPQDTRSAPCSHEKLDRDDIGDLYCLECGMEFTE